MKTVLIIETEKTQQEIWRQICIESGFKQEEIAVAALPTEAMESFMEYRADLRLIMVADLLAPQTHETEGPDTTSLVFRFKQEIDFQGKIIGMLDVKTHAAVMEQAGCDETFTVKRRKALPKYLRELIHLAV